MEKKKKVAWNKGLKKQENLEEIRQCKECKKEKIITEFRKWKHLFRYICRECYAAQYRTGKPNTGRFKKGHQPKCPFKKGHKPERPFPKGNIPWNKGVFTTTKRHSRRHVDWSKKVRKRDGNKCTKCHSTKGLHAHHVIPWKNNEENRFDISNGITLCRSCHAKIEGFQNGHEVSEEIRLKISRTKKEKQCQYQETQ